MGNGMGVFSEGGRKQGLDGKERQVVWEGGGMQELRVEMGQDRGTGLGRVRKWRLSQLASARS